MNGPPTNVWVVLLFLSISFAKTYNSCGRGLDVKDEENRQEGGKNRMPNSKSFSRFDVKNHLN